MSDDRRSLWHALSADTNQARVSTPATSTQVDVVVVGAGLAGLCTALACQEDGATVAVIEARSVAERTTGHSTAKLTALHGATYSSLLEGKGLETAVRYAAANVEGLLRMRALIDRLGIDCGLREATAYTCAGTDDGVGAIEAEASAAGAAGLPVELVTITELDLPVTRAVALAGQASFDPLAFCRGLAKELSARGVQIYENTSVREVEESDDGCVVRGEFFELRSDFAVVTTHLPIVDPALLSARVRPERSYVVAGPTPGRTVPDGMYLAIDQGWSVRSAMTDAGPVLLVGGEGHSMTDHVDGAEHYARLEAFSRDRLGVDVQHRWSAFDYATTDGLPFIGRLASGSSRRFTATGFHKWGMTTSMVSAMIIGDLIAGRENPYLEVFDATRVVSTLSRDLVRNSAKVAGRFVGDRISARRADDDELAPGEGRVVHRDGQEVAVARDLTGTLRAVSAICTHVGCVVGFNGSEQTWDCPCHGSRFGLDGSVIEGPATTPLQTMETASTG